VKASPRLSGKMGCGYVFAKFMMTSTLNVFFANGVEVVNQDNIPKKGPVILVGPHFNQFVDAMVMLKAAGSRRPGFIIAEKSMHRPVVGDFARMLNAVPVVRPQDLAKPGPGKIMAIDVDKLTLTGSGTSFVKDLEGQGLVAVKGVGAFAINKVVSDTEITIKPLSKDEPPAMEKFTPGLGYKIVPKVSQDEVFEAVYARLLGDGAIAIFPEGGSHDNTELLPLKAGVTMMALGAAARGAPVKICAVGMNYFNAHVFRSNAFVDVSQPIELSPELVSRFMNGEKKEACAELLETIRKTLKSVIMHAPDYETLKAVRTARRMYQNGVKLSAKDYLKLNNRFMEASETWREQADPEYEQLLQDIIDYLNFCWAQGLTDKQVRDLPPLGTCTAWLWAVWELCKTSALVLVALPISLPGLILNLPIALRVSIKVKAEMAKALAGSNVKVAARDVAASQKVMVGATTTMALMLFYTVLGFVLLFVFWPRDLAPEGQWYSFLAVNGWWIIPLLFLFLFPIYTFYFVVRVGEAVGRRLRLLPAHLIGLISICRSTRRNPAEVLRTDRKRLVLRVQEFIEKKTEDMPGWAQDRVIPAAEVYNRRSQATLKLLEQGDLEPHIKPSRKPVSAATVSVEIKDKAPKL
jgi:glycerol-3-phosphate O-acyltransferase/dihydroxyacetone phosphate acyltransferase